MSAETILKLIEAVDPSDTVAMYEIDARVWCWVRGYEYLGKRHGHIFNYKDDEGHEYSNIGSEYTRSRDALKAIRPDGYALVIGKIWPDYFTIARIFHVKDPVAFETKEMKTEELAELHAIIQAIEYERNAE